MSRKKRKRYRRHIQLGLQPEASADNRPLWGGWGEGVEMTRGDWVLVRRAANQDWGTAQMVRNAVCRGLSAAIDASEHSPRLSLAVIWAALAMDKADLRDEQLALAGQQTPQTR